MIKFIKSINLCDRWSYSKKELFLNLIVYDFKLNYICFYLTTFPWKPGMTGLNTILTKYYLVKLFDETLGSHSVSFSPSLSLYLAVFHLYLSILLFFSYLSLSHCLPSLSTSLFCLSLKKIFIFVLNPNHIWEGELSHATYKLVKSHCVLTIITLLL